MWYFLREPLIKTFTKSLKIKYVFKPKFRQVKAIAEKPNWYRVTGECTKSENRK